MQWLVNIDMPDLGRAIDTRAFALRLGRRLGADAVEPLGGPAPINLLGKGPDPVASPRSGHRRNDQRHWTPAHLDVVVAVRVRRFDGVQTWKFFEEIDAAQGRAARCQR